VLLCRLRSVYADVRSFESPRPDGYLYPSAVGNSRQRGLGFDIADEMIPNTGVVPIILLRYMTKYFY
jgi:hypothetical protein